MRHNILLTEGFNIDDFVKVKNQKKCHAELGSASHKINHLRDPETKSG